MNSKSLKILLVAIAVLVAIYFISTPGRMGNGDQENGSLLMPALKAHINDIMSISVNSGENAFTIVKTDDRWTVEERDGYAANIGQLRQLLLALGDAKIIETKTSSPDKYGILGVDDPASEGSAAVLISLVGDGYERGVIIGKAAQGNYRYARLADSEQSVLINQNPDVPDSAAGWLDSELLDIPSSEIKAVSIEHADGEQISITKADRDETNFTVNNIPEGRELSYATVANGIGGALDGLQLEDVRKATDAGEAVASTVFDSFDGLSVVLSTVLDGDKKWISIAASEGNPAAVDINARLAGWQFRLADYKANLLVRRFEDLLKAVESDAE